MSKVTITPEQIDALLPQTQCGLCGHGGCMPYAEAIVFEREALNLCPPGGVATLLELGALCNQDVTAFVPEMGQKAKPPMLAVVREDECIGCTKCIQVCPVDAILGSAKHMHTVIAAECTGCELCVPACPVDCIDMVSVADIQTEPQKKAMSDLARTRYNARNKRLTEAENNKKMIRLETNLAVKRNYVQEAIARAKRQK